MMDKFMNYDFLELVIFDIHSMPKGRLVAKHRVESVLKDGMGMYSGICYFGVRGEPITHAYFGDNRNYGNQRLVPLPDTLTNVLPSAQGKHSVGQVLCQLLDQDGNQEPTTPRAVVEKQIRGLASRGFRLRSSIELEFGIYQADGLQPFGHAQKWANMRVIGRHEDLLLDFVQELKATGIVADTLQTEAGDGQFEMTLDVDDCLQMADKVCRFKNAASIFFTKRDLRPSFMTRPQVEGFSHGFHFNHSLWTPDGQRVFLDGQDPDRLSATGRHWLAGLVTHARALTALYCPTVNCYRRLHHPWTPSRADWYREHRNSAFRLKVEGQDNVYLENRIPSSASNPYLVTAGVIAAGMDGINRKLSLEEVDCDQELPRSLESALKALEEDDYMVEALGRDFVKLFGLTKRMYELEAMKPLENFPDQAKLEKERNLYFENC